MARSQREIPWLDQRDGVFYVNWYDAGSRRTSRLSLRTRDAGEAQNRYVAFLSEGQGVIRSAPAAGLTVAEALDQYLAEHECSAKWRQETAARHLKAYWGDTPIKTIDIPESRRYLAARGKAARPAGGTTVRRELVTLVAAANHAVRWKRLSPRDVPMVELPPHAPKKEAHYLTKQELKDLLAHLSGSDDPRPLAFTVLAYLSSARRERVQRLTWPQVDIARRRLRLLPHGERETKKRATTVPLNDEMIQQLYKLRAAYPDSEYVFGFPGYDVYKKFRKACLDVGIDAARAHPHVLRHTRATHLLQDGVSIFETAQILADTVETVERNYGHHCPDYMERSGAFRSLDGMLN